MSLQSCATIQDKPTGILPSDTSTEKPMSEPTVKLTVEPMKQTTASVSKFSFSKECLTQISLTRFKKGNWTSTKQKRLEKLCNIVIDGQAPFSQSQSREFCQLFYEKYFNCILTDGAVNFAELSALLIQPLDEVIAKRNILSQDVTNVQGHTLTKSLQYAKRRGYFNNITKFSSNKKVLRWEFSAITTRLYISDEKEVSNLFKAIKSFQSTKEAKKYSYKYSNGYVGLLKNINNIRKKHPEILPYIIADCMLTFTDVSNIAFNNVDASIIPTSIVIFIREKRETNS